MQAMFLPLGPDVSSNAACARRTIVRLRPSPELKLAHPNCLFPTSETSLSFIPGDATSFSFTYDSVLPQAATQSDVFNTVQSALEASLCGQNGTIMTYGQVRCP